MRLISFCRRCCWKRCLERQWWQTQQHVRIMIRVHTNQNPAGSPHNTLNTNPEENGTKSREKDFFNTTVKIWASALTNKMFFTDKINQTLQMRHFLMLLWHKKWYKSYLYKINNKQFFFTLECQLSLGQCRESSAIWHPVVVTIDCPSLVHLQSLATATGWLCLYQKTLTHSEWIKRRRVTHTTVHSSSCSTVSLHSSDPTHRCSSGCLLPGTPTWPVNKPTYHSVTYTG